MMFPDDPVSIRMPRVCDSSPLRLSLRGRRLHATIEATTLKKPVTDAAAFYRRPPLLPETLTVLLGC